MPFKIPQPQNGIPHDLKLSADAQMKFREYRVENELALRPGGDFEDLTDWANRLPGTAARLAGVLHMFACAEASEPYPWNLSISGETIGNAIRLAGYFAEHAEVAFAFMEADGKLAKARKVWTSVQRHFPDRFTQRDLWQKVRRQFVLLSELGEVLTFLSEMGYVREIQREDNGRPGRKPSLDYEVNPLNRTHNTPNDAGDHSQGDFVDSVYDSLEVDPESEERFLWMLQRYWTSFPISESPYG